MNNQGICVGLSTFLASSKPAEENGTSGVTSTHASICLLGKFQDISSLKHENLCEYVDLIRGGQERMVIAEEHYTKSLSNLDPENVKEKISHILYGILCGLSHLHSNNITHRNLCPSNILLTDDNQIKLSKWGLYHLSSCNKTLSFPIGNPLYISPEHLLMGGIDSFNQCNDPISDIWSFGIVVFDWLTRLSFVENQRNKSASLVKFVLGLIKSEQNILQNLIDSLPRKELTASWSEDLKDLLNNCLKIDPSERKTSAELLKHPLFRNIPKNTLTKNEEMPPYWKYGYPDYSIDGYFAFEAPNPSQSNLNYNFILRNRSTSEIYFLLKLMVGDVFTKMKSRDLVDHLPAIFSFPCYMGRSGTQLGKRQDQTSYYNESVVVLKLDEVEQRIKSLPFWVNYPLTSISEPTTVSLNEIAKHPSDFKEKNIVYQIYRTNLFRNLLDTYPFTQKRIFEEAKIDIPPLFRGRVWACLLNVKGDYKKVYARIDKVSPTSSDRQIDVDTPRCHQYEQVMSTLVTREKLKRILKAWIKSNKNLVYWQGLDSFSASFLTVNINDEALAFACINQFINKYCYNFFLKDNSSIITQYLCVFTQLIAFHDPELACHLDSISFKAELYAIPWFLTMFAHVFPLTTVRQIWDILLLANAMFPMCLGCAILMNMRAKILASEFNTCILLFTDLPGMDIPEILKLAITIYNGTPPSFGTNIYSPIGKFIRDDFSSKELPFLEYPDRKPLPLSELENETSPRISCRDAFRILKSFKSFSRNYDHKAPVVISTSRLPSSFPIFSPQDKNKQPVLIDIRPQEEFNTSQTLNSINIPVQKPYTFSEIPFEKFHKYKGQMIILFSSNPKEASMVAGQLVKCGFRFVCVLEAQISSNSSHV